MLVSIIITVVSGKESVRRCLEALHPQVNPDEGEIIVPYDKWSTKIGCLAVDFPGVRFHFISEPGFASLDKVTSRQHRLYDRRRAVGLTLARGQIIAMTEDHAVPAADWYSQILAAHQQPYAVIGGLIDNGIDKPLNWALYYCDFGRCGSPRSSGVSEYVSDVNVTYKRNALETVSGLWRDAYHETTVHWALQSRGEKLFLDSRLRVYQHRPAISLRQAYRERIEWGRVFAETRVASFSVWARLLYAAGTPALPAILFLRVLRHMIRQRRTINQITRAAPFAACLLIGWALGELAGYLMGKPRARITMAASESRSPQVGNL
jgi:hypothetical protein